MRKLAILGLLMAILFGCAAPSYAWHHHGHHLNKEARAAQKRNKARAKQLKREARQRRKARSGQTL